MLSKRMENSILTPPLPSFVDPCQHRVLNGPFEVLAVHRHKNNSLQVVLFEGMNTPKAHILQMCMYVCMYIYICVLNYYIGSIIV